MVRPHSIGVVLSIWLGLGSLMVQASDEISVHERFARGMVAFAFEEYDKAALLWASVWDEQPAYQDSLHGAVAYWLGEAYAKQGDPSKQRWVWQVGLNMLDQSGRFDVRLSDAYLDLVFREGNLDERLDEALLLYLGLVAHFDSTVTAPEQAILTRYAAQLDLILPDDIRHQVIATMTPEEAWRFQPAASEALIAWWRSDDPLPATRHNERLIEHLGRLAYARTHFASDTRTTGFDERGDIMVRLGTPSHRSTIKYTDSKLTDLTFQPGVTVTLAEYPDNEYWVYGHIDRSAYYIFVRRDGQYVVATVEDLLPRSLQGLFSSSKRGQRNARVAVETLRWIYRHLAMQHPAFETRYNDVDSYVMRLEEGSASGSFDGPPKRFARRFMVQGRSEDQQAAYERTQYVPRQYTEALAGTEPLPIALRTARFLAEDGTTRTDLYWTPEPGALRPSRAQRRQLEREGYGEIEDYLIEITAVQKRLDYTERIVNKNRYQVVELPAKKDLTVPVQTMSVHGDTGRYHLAVQWDQHVLESGRDIGPRIKIGTARLDSMIALPTKAETLVMSDVVPVWAEEIPAEEGLPGTPYPFVEITKNTPLALYFEVYHLTYTGDDQTNYRVEYEMVRREESGFLRVLGGTSESRTSGQMRYQGTDRTVQESILLDLSAWEGQGSLDVIVRVTDENTGAVVSRTLAFEVVAE